MKALEGVRILDFTHVQSGSDLYPVAGVVWRRRDQGGTPRRRRCHSQVSCWMFPMSDSLYFTMLNHNKRSITLNTKLIESARTGARPVAGRGSCDVLVENFAPGALDRMGFGWERIQELNPRMIMASIKGFGPGAV